VLSGQYPLANTGPMALRQTNDEVVC
jgi:hypothetical protein